MNAKNSIDLSVVIPVYNEEHNLSELYRRLTMVLGKELRVKYELLFVDDGSSDSSWSIVEELHKRNKNVKGIKLSQNCGHDLAIKTGIDHCRGRIAVFMDSDLQHPPEILEEIYKSISSGECDILFLKRISNENEQFSRKIVNRLYYYCFKKMTGIDISEGISDFFAVNEKVIAVVKEFKEKSYFNRGVVLSIGFRKKFLEYKAGKRFAGESKYRMKDLFQLSVKSFVNFSALPLKLVTIIGLCLSMLSFAYGLYSIIKTLLVGSISGWASIVTTVSFLNGFIILLLAIFFEYFVVMFNEIKNRPPYIIDKML